ncbi:MAG: hypothetical protein QM594_07335 [Niabella sp.]
MKAIRLLIVISIGCILAGCAIQRTSKFTLDTINSCISKEEVIAVAGKPYKQTFHYGADSSLYETYYYKEPIWKSNWFEVNNMLRFKNGKLESLEQGREKHLYTEHKKN